MWYTIIVQREGTNKRKEVVTMKKIQISVGVISAKHIAYNSNHEEIGATTSKKVIETFDLGAAENLYTYLILNANKLDALETLQLKEQFPRAAFGLKYHEYNIETREFTKQEIAQRIMVF